MKNAIELYEERNKHILDLYNQGLTLKEIGTLYNISRERVRQLIEKQQVDKNPHYAMKKIKLYNKTKDEIDLEFIKEARFQHKSWAYICKALNTYYCKLREHIDFNECPFGKIDGMQYCSVCEKWDYVANFYIVKQGKYRSYRHKPCTNKYIVEWKRKRKEKNNNE